MAKKMSVTGPVKTTISLPEDAVAILHDLATDRNVSFAEVVRRALKMEKFLADARKQGGRVLIEDAQKRLKEMIFF